MKSVQRGFALIELLLALAITGILGTGAAVTISQLFQNNTRNNDYLSAVIKIETAGNYISKDVQTAEEIQATGLSGSNFVILYWNERSTVQGTITVSHVITYYFSGVSNHVGKLMRNHWSSSGTDTDTLITERIYFNASDPDNSSKAEYNDPALTVRLKSVVGNESEVREYTIERRVNSIY